MQGEPGTGSVGWFCWASAGFRNTRAFVFWTKNAVPGPERFKDDELSAIQHAMQWRLQGEAALVAEYRYKPLPGEVTEDDRMSAEQVIKQQPLILF